MISGDAQAIVHALQTMENRLLRVEQMLFNKLRISKIINVNDENVHIVMEVVKYWETPEGVIVQVK